MTTPHPTLTLIEQRISANRFDASHRLADAEIERLVELATRAPTAYNLQNWRFIAVRTPAAKARLRAVAQDQAKVEEAAVCFIVCGVLADPQSLAERLQRICQAVAQWPTYAREAGVPAVEIERISQFQPAWTRSFA